MGVPVRQPSSPTARPNSPGNRMGKKQTRLLPLRTSDRLEPAPSVTRVVIAGNCWDRLTALGRRTPFVCRPTCHAGQREAQKKRAGWWRLVG
ncbi:hypothetical protein BaRGS_00004645 [Batillaria attramentaria]|uniref:Uncharacterized protein n=1 Tax=Batillaria attramentaria TaxID=370345 RepID=A0ABD0LXZ9_9CAEN